MGERPTQGLHAVKFGLAITAIGGLLFTFDLPLLRLAGADMWTLVFTRGVMLFLALTASWFVSRQFYDSKTPFIDGKAGLAVVCTSTIANIAFIGAVVNAHAANVVFILALVPVLTAVFSFTFIGEKVQPLTWVATLVAFLGVAIIVQDGLHSGRLWGDVMAFICACCTAAAFTITRASGKKVATSLGLGSLCAAMFALVVFGVDFDSLVNAGSYGLPALFFIAMNGLLVIPLASSLMVLGPRYLPSVDVSMFFLLETVLTPIWVWMLFGEAPTNVVLWGGAIVVVTLVAHSLWRLGIGSKLQAPAHSG